MPSERGPHCQDPTIVPKVPKYRIKRSKIKGSNAFAADRGYNKVVAAVASVRQPTTDTILRRERPVPRRVPDPRKRRPILADRLSEAEVKSSGCTRAISHSTPATCDIHVARVLRMPSLTPFAAIAFTNPLLHRSQSSRTPQKRVPEKQFHR